MSQLAQISKRNLRRLNNVCRIQSSHSQVLTFHKHSTQEEIACARCILTYRKYSVWFRRGISPCRKHKVWCENCSTWSHLFDGHSIQTLNMYIILRSWQFEEHLKFGPTVLDICVVEYRMSKIATGSVGIPTTVSDLKHVTNSMWQNEKMTRMSKS